MRDAYEFQSFPQTSGSKSSINAVSSCKSQKRAGKVSTYSGIRDRYRHRMANLEFRLEISKAASEDKYFVWLVLTGLL